MNLANGAEVGIYFACFPVGALLNAIDGGEGGAFESDKDFGATSIVRERQKFIILSDGNVGFGKPTNVFFGDSAEQVL